jgi:hypothetical protein
MKRSLVSQENLDRKSWLPHCRLKEAGNKAKTGYPDIPGTSITRIIRGHASGRAMFPAGFLQVVFVMSVVDAHLAVINFKNTVDERA